MIVEWLIDLFLGFMEWFSEQLPTDEAPEFIGTISGAITQLTDAAAGLGGWVPWSYLGVVSGTILTLWVAFWTVKGLRWLWGLTPFSGGS